MAPEEGTASCRHRAAREGEPRMGLTARGEPGPQKGDRKGWPRANETRAAATAIQRSGPDAKAGPPDPRAESDPISRSDAYPNICPSAR